MSTNSVIARIEGDTWRGRYVHWDGYPEHMGVTLTAIIARDGVEVALRTILDEHRGWSTLNGDAEQSAAMLGADRANAVPGYGVAYSDAEQPDEWITREGDTWGAEYAYVVDPASGRITAYRRDYAAGRWVALRSVTAPVG